MFRSVTFGMLGFACLGMLSVNSSVHRLTMPLNAVPRIEKHGSPVSELFMNPMSDRDRIRAIIAQRNPDHRRDHDRI